MGAFLAAVRHLTGRLNKQSIKDLIPEVTSAEEKLISKSLSMSMTSPEGIWANLTSIKYVAENRIPGDLVEFGVWRGGGLFSMLEGLSIYEPESRRQVFGFDTFSGMTSPSVQDHEISSGEQAIELLKRHQNRKESSVVWAIGSLKDVNENLREAQLHSNLKLIEGDVAITLEGSGIAQIALARLDTDWYESTKLELAFTWPRLSVGGVLIIDDYGHWNGARQAFDEFIQELPEKPLIHRVDYTARLVVKGRY